MTQIALMIAQLVLVDKKLVSLWIQKLEETSKAAKRHVNGTFAACDGLVIIRLAANV